MATRTRLRAVSTLTFVLYWAVACAAPTNLSEPRLSAVKGAGGPPSASPTVTSTNPTSAEQGTTLDVWVFGTGYDQGSKADLLLAGKVNAKVRTNQTSYVSETELVANITIDADATVADYDVRVTDSRGKKGIGIESFAVLAAGPPGQWDPPQLDVTFRQGSGGTDAVRGDDPANSPYPGLASISGNGNLQFWLGSGSPRSVRATTSAWSGFTRDRIYTNNHTNPDGDDSFGMMGMAQGSEGTAVFEVELNVHDNDPYEVLRYGKDCSGRGAGDGTVIPATKVVTTRSVDGRTWTFTGTNGVHCRQVGKKPGLTQVGTAGPFSVTMVWP